MFERNPCRESGCPGLCCQDIDLEVTKAEVKELFPTAKELSSLDEFKSVPRRRKGLFFTKYERPGLEGPDFRVLAINGPCPNRSAQGNCNIHDHREHAAKNFHFGSPDCNAIRAENGLAPVYVEPVE